MIAQGRLKDLGPLLVIWGGAMLVLVETNDLGSGLLYFGVFLSMLYIATARFAYVIAGSVLFVIGSFGVYRISGHVRDRVDVWLHAFRYADSTGYQLVQARYSIAHGGFGGTGFGRGIFTQPGSSHTLIPYLNTDFIYAALAQEMGLIGVVRAAARLHGLHRARLSDRAAHRRRVLEAARGGLDVRLRASDVHHHRRDHRAHSADGHHDAVRQLRRLERRGELRPPRRADAPVESRERAARRAL